MIACIIWIIIALVVLWCGLPTPDMFRHNEGIVLYYLCWIPAVILMFLIHFHLMPIFSSTVLEIREDYLIGSFFIVIFVLRVFNLRRKI